MTSEVALMNRSAVALAADSAATVTYWDADKGEHEQRFFKRANKIFNMSSGRPVGLMTYQSSSLQGMPWEVLVKAYRDARQGSSKATLAEYATDLFDYLAASREIFSVSDQEAHLLSSMVETSISQALAVVMHDDVEAATDASKKKAVIDKLVNDLEKNVKSDSYFNDVAKEIHADVQNTNLPNIIAEVEAHELGKHAISIAGAAIIKRIVTLSTEAMFKTEGTAFEYTGIVVAGYGETQYLPQLEHFKVYGLFKNKLIYVRLDKQCKSIDSQNLSEIVPIAQSKMINTFRLGADLTTLGKIEEVMRATLTGLVDDLKNNGTINKQANVDAAKSKMMALFNDQVNEYIWKEHGKKLRRVIGMLSPEELAELAETFVSVESLKERVTSPTETVSGPIDVAVITKGDGFIWIKRKHYFDPSLNLRFVAKKHSEVGN